MKNIHDYLEVAIHRQASDLIIKAGASPSIRVHGVLLNTDIPALTPYDARELAYSIVYSASRDYLLQYVADGPDESSRGLLDAEHAIKQLDQGKELDVVFTIPKLARVRANLFLERGAVGAALRIIPLTPSTLSDLMLPPILADVALQPQGMIILTGQTGSGKTTTMAAMIEEINRRRYSNIFTIEEPIEYVFSDRKSVVHQREVGTDTQSFESGLHSVMRQSPDVIAIGELRDQATMDVAMTAAEIGHLVITTLHTVSAAATIDRIINSFPQHLQRQVSGQLSASLLCITSQRLIPRADGNGRVPAVEVLMASPMVRTHIKDSQTNELYNVMRDDHHYGMNTMNQALERLYHDNIIEQDAAMQYAGNQTELRQMLRRG